MNVMSVLNQVMRQLGTADGSAPPMEGLSLRAGGTSGRRADIDVASLLGGGALGLMLGSKRGRKMGGKVIKYGALAGVGALAWKAYQDYQANSGTQVAGHSRTPEGQPLEQLQGSAQEQRGLEILQAMIMAARADGHVDARERAQLSEAIEKLGADDELHAWIQQQFDAPLDAAVLAAIADSPQARREIYLVSAIMVDEQNPMERAWLDQLAAALGLDNAMVAELEGQLRSEGGP